MTCNFWQFFEFVGLEKRSHTVEIHGSRTVPFNKNYKISFASLFFRVRMLPRRYVRFCKIGSMERQKRITFKKKFIKKYLFVEEICHFQEQKSVKFPQKSGAYYNGKPMQIDNLENGFALIFLWKCPGFLRKFHTFGLLKMTYLLDK